MQQTQSELRAAQFTLAQSEYGKEKRLKILRRTHQSALSLKQSLIQELQDIVTEKDEYISQLENRLTGKESDIRKPRVIIIIGLFNFIMFIFFQDNGLVKVVDRFSRLSKDYVDLQSKYEQTKEELIEEQTRKNEDSHSVNQGSKSVCNSHTKC